MIVRQGSGNDRARSAARRCDFDLKMANMIVYDRTYSIGSRNARGAVTGPYGSSAFPHQTRRTPRHHARDPTGEDIGVEFSPPFALVDLLEWHVDFESMHRAIGDLDTTIRNAWGIASFVVVEYSIAGVQLASIDWVPLRPDHVVKLHTVDVAELRDGRIARIRRYDNVGEIAEDLP